MIKKYYSSYTGKQIDEAVKAIIENGISWEDFSPELQEYLKSLAKKELVFNNHFEFPSIGNSETLYIAVDENKIYYWKDSHYVVISGVELDEIAQINGGGAK